MTAAAAIEIRDLHKHFRRGRDVVRAVNGLDLTIRRGEVFGLLGPNGAGKTTTVEICEGLQSPTAGDVVVLGQRWRDPDRVTLRQRIGVSLQETPFFGKQTVRETLTLFRCFHDHGRDVGECLELLSLQEKADSPVRTLSGGQRQRLAVATALVGDPELLFLDEPTTGLDPQSRRALWDVVRRFREGGGTVLLTTHYMEEATRLCDRVGVVDGGELIALGSPDELVASLGGEHVVEVSSAGIDDALAESAVAALPGVHGARFARGQLALTVAAPHLAIPPLLQLVHRAGLELDGLSTRHASLEDVFVGLTGRHLREE